MRLAYSVIPRSFPGHSCHRTTTSLVSRLTAHPFPKSLCTRLDSHVLQYTYCLQGIYCSDVPQEALKFVAKYTTEKVRLLAFVKNRGKGGAVRMVCLCFSSFSVSSCVNEDGYLMPTIYYFPNSSWYPITSLRYVCVKNMWLFKLYLTPMSPNFKEPCGFKLS